MSRRKLHCCKKENYEKSLSYRRYNVADEKLKVVTVIDTSKGIEFVRKRVDSGRWLKI
ncbi:hypothetical protein [Archaeoglobus veneficus]|uniref:hypothetical protein n=1 Tax=Archaeoglobus veneficus TaxID=58290 RepID=UPI000A8127C7|nr:hypothetical protein [Archaeoglobus veneficus]